MSPFRGQDTNFYLDTSTINHLVYDSDSSKLVQKLQKHVTVYISVFTVAELAATINKKIRNKLLESARSISSDYRPLAMPKDILSRSLQAILAGDTNMNYSMGEEWNGLWAVLCNPDLIDEKNRSEACAWKTKQEKWYQDMHDHGRPRMQETMTRLSKSDQKTLTSFPKMIRSFPQSTLYDIVTDIALSLCGANTKLTKENVTTLIKQSEAWRFFLSSMAYSLYVRSMQRNSYGRNSNPGSIDTQQAIYLSGCDIFVTADNQQYRMLRLQIPFGHIKQEIWNYKKFRVYITSLIKPGC